MGGRLLLGDNNDNAGSSCLLLTTEPLQHQQRDKDGVTLFIYQ